MLANLEVTIPHLSNRDINRPVLSVQLQVHENLQTQAFGQKHVVQDLVPKDALLKQGLQYPLVIQIFGV